MTPFDQLLAYVKATYPNDTQLLALVQALGGGQAQPDDGGGNPPSGGPGHP